MSYENAVGSGASTIKDVYLGMIAGQFGFLGLIGYVIIMFTIFKVLLYNSGKGRTKAITLAAFVTVLASMMVSANTTTSEGLTLFAILGLVSNLNIEESEDTESVYYEGTYE